MWLENLLLHLTMSVTHGIRREVLLDLSTKDDAFAVTINIR